MPHRVRGETHYAALLKKYGGVATQRGSDAHAVRPRADKKAEALFKDFASRCLSIGFERLHSVADRLYSLPECYVDLGVQTLRAGIELGEISNGRFIPSHSLAMCLSPQQARFIELDQNTALSYLSGNTFPCGQTEGWAVASYLGFSLGWCKVSGGVAKNHLPKALRINN